MTAAGEKRLQNGGTPGWRDTNFVRAERVVEDLTKNRETVAGVLAALPHFANGSRAARTLIEIHEVSAGRIVGPLHIGELQFGPLGIRKDRSGPVSQEHREIVEQLGMLRLIDLEGGITDYRTTVRITELGQSVARGLKQRMIGTDRKS